MNYIKVEGAREHNLKNININIPRNKFVVLTGVSGSGKSSLAFDTVYAEGHRRFVESISTHARQFLGQMRKPDVDSIAGMTPAISIQQKVAFGSTRSTVGTTTEIYDYLRVLFARIGEAFCHKCFKPIHSQTTQEIVEQLLKYNQKKIFILSPIIKSKKGNFSSLFKDLQSSGFIRARIDGNITKLDDKISLKKHLTHDIEVIIDRLTVSPDMSGRLTESINTALSMGKGNILVLFDGNESFTELSFSELNACPDCGISIGSLTPGMFSFNSPYGACDLCHGLGVIDIPDENLLVVDSDLSINEGAIPLIVREDVPMLKSYRKILDLLSSNYKIDLNIPWRRLDKKLKQILLEGGSDITFKITTFEAGKPKVKEEEFNGIKMMIFDRYQNTEKTLPRDIIKRYLTSGECPKCKGKRLKAESLSIKINNYSIIDITEASIEKALQLFKTLDISEAKQQIGKDVISEISKRLQFLINVGLGYLSLSRCSNTLGGGEAQRIKLATQIGSGLIGVLYVLDEPTIGLHPRDISKLLKSLNNLRKQGNSLLIVEHDEATIESAEHIIELGPEAGVNGGYIVFEGTLDEMLKSDNSKTGNYLNGKIKIPIPKKRRPFNPKNCLKISGCTQNNLKNIDVQFPLNCFVTVTGVSGSGKSTLVNKTLHKALQDRLTRAKVTPGKHKSLKGYKDIQSIIEINQSPIGRTPRSNPATYTGIFDLIRDWYAKLETAKVMGLKPSHFSFNVRGGRCEACSGDGVRKIEMHFLPDVYVPCEVCKGQRYDPEILNIKYKNQSISDILQSTVAEATLIFKNIKPIYDKLKLLMDVGLGYIKLGQSATTLSGGEAQRIKLAAELGQKSKGNTIYILDEPTTGLHMADIHVLLEVLQKLVKKGNSVIVIEHNLDVIASSDYLIDLGPEGGDKGGEITALGTPEEVMENKNSHTGSYLKQHLKKIIR